jgi:hypothetical protein
MREKHDNIAWSKNDFKEGSRGNLKLLFQKYPEGEKP